MPGTVIVFRHQGRESPREHEVATQAAVGRMLSELLGYGFAGVYEPGRRYAGHRFFVPHDTLLAADAARLGIESADDLFGGVVPFPFMGTKVISHQLVGTSAGRPEGWRDAFPAAVADCVLRGFTAFGRDDARAAARELLADGPVRLKRPLAAGGRGQRIAHTAEDVEATLASFSDGDLAGSGIVLETNLADVSTFSVGQVTIRGRTISYLGSQHETRDNDGGQVYGGSDLTVVRGGWEALGRIEADGLARQAIAQAMQYDRATAAFPGFYASRRNYDVAAGVDGRGRRCLGVLEASWRLGGASPAEVAALQALSGEPGLAQVRVATVERYGRTVEVPGDAVVHFDGIDPVAGPLVRYTRIARRAAA